MACDDPVDGGAMIFTEKDVYMICGVLAEVWGLDRDAESECEDIEGAITTILAHSHNYA